MLSLVGVLSLSLFGSQINKEYRKEIQSSKFLKEVAKKINKNLPILIDPMTKLVLVTASYKNLNYVYTITGEKYYSKIKSKDFTNYVIKKTCHNEKSLIFIGNGIQLNFYYYDINRNLLNGILVKPIYCDYKEF